MDAVSSSESVDPSRRSGAAESAGDREAALAAELNHRVLNALTVVQSLARRTFAEGGDPLAQQAAFVERLRVLCAIHRLLGRNQWAFANLRCTLEIALAPHPVDRWRLEGPVLALAPEAAVDVAMVFGELAANAGRHGALSGGRGIVEVTWRSDLDRAEVTWCERGVRHPPDLARPALGLRMAEQLVTRQLGGALAVDTRADGLTWRLAFATRRRS